jgi:hypothetical protein
MTFLLVLLALLVSVAVIQLRFTYRHRQLAKRGWREVLAQIEPVDIEGLRAIAECYLRPDKDQLRLQPIDMWTIVGGLDGISRLRSNAAAMLDLAVFAERWNQEEGPVVSEMIRRDAVRLKRAATRIQLIFFFKLGFLRAPFHLLEAASSYYLIRSRLLGLYKNSHPGLSSHLAAAL